jgi:hypothetical protein
MPTRVRDLKDTDLQDLNNSKNKYVLRYNANFDKFDVVSVDSILSETSTDSDVPDDFVTQVEEEIDVNNIAFAVLDGGTF